MKKISLYIFILSFNFLSAQLKTKIIDESIEIFQLDDNSIKVKTYAKKAIFSNEENIDAHFLEYYQESNKIKIKYIKIYNRFGALLKNVNKSDIYYTNASSNTTLYSDVFRAYYELKRPELPYVIEYEFETIYDDILNFPEWNPQASNTIVEKSSFTINALADTKVNYKYYNFNPEFSLKKDGNTNIYSWSYSNDSIIKNQENYYALRNYGLPKMIVNSDKFLMHNVSGDFSSWKNFGDFYYHLNKDRKALPEKLKLKLNDFKKRASSKMELLEFIYGYLQESKRYISINLDLSGYQSMTVDETENKAYGDCKALSNYLESSLNYVGIESYSALVLGRRNVFHFEKDFVCNQFNHVICCSIINEDTIWLESTSNKEAVNFLSDFTCNRPALIIKENNSKLVQTPSYKNDFNFSDIKVKAVLEENSNATLYYNLKLKGLNQNLYRKYISKTQDAEIMKFLKYYFNYLGDFEIKEFSIESIDHSSPNIHLKVEIEKPNFYQKIGSNYLIHLNCLSPMYEIPKIDIENRKSDFFYPYGIKEIYELTLDFKKLSDSNYKVEPIEKEITTSEVKSSYSLMNKEDNTIVQKLQYSINTFQCTPKELEKFTDAFKASTEMFDIKVIVKSLSQ